MYKMSDSKFNMSDFVDELELLVNNSAENAKLAIENARLRERIEVLERDQQTLVNAKATEYMREVEIEVMVRLALKLSPIFGLTQPKNYESMVREFLKKQA